MTTDTKKLKGGSKLSRSEITTIRLDPKLKYLADLAARKQRRTLSSYIEWAIEDSLSRFMLREGEYEKPIGAQTEELWDVDAADRLARLAIRYPELLTHSEQLVWKLVKENGFFWKGRFGKASKRWEWDISESKFLFVRLREYFPSLLAVASGVAAQDVLPDWNRTEAEEMSGDFSRLDLNVIE